ncbi:hypothetical protein LWI28_023665 [Acer negundo]|uniref:Uncharacterized protein n=1 Tax=Acer negundo TaxID=4023 RepID=A0AAD5INS1_ACENE|nr:hypothetical protein LWI28_023665 [Acer negundo]
MIMHNAFAPTWLRWHSGLQRLEVLLVKSRGRHPSALIVGSSQPTTFPSPVVPADRPSKVDMEKDTGYTTAHSIDLPPRASSQSRGHSQDEVLTWFKTACPGGCLRAMSSMPVDILVTMAT